MKNSFVFSVFPVLVASFALIWGTEVDEKPPAITPLQYNYLGMIGKKQYFSEDALYTWDVAYRLCNTSAMQLATVDTAEESIFLANALVNKTSSLWYWIAARNLQEYSYEMVTGETLPVNKSRFSPWVDNQPNRLCVIVHSSGSDGLLRAQTTLCTVSGSTSTYSVLCQIVQ